jgi:hypothetical protein
MLFREWPIKTNMYWRFTDWFGLSHSHDRYCLYRFNPVGQQYDPCFHPMAGFEWSVPLPDYDLSCIGPCRPVFLMHSERHACPSQALISSTDIKHWLIDVVKMHSCDRCLKAIPGENSLLSSNLRFPSKRLTFRHGNRSTDWSSQSLYPVSLVLVPLGLIN